MKKKIIIGIVILIVVIILSYLLYLVIEDNSKQNTLVEFDTVEEYYDELINVSEDDTNYMDDLIFSIYTLGYRDDFMKLYDDNVKSCLYDNENCEVEELYPVGEVTTPFREIKPVYVVLLRQLDGEVEYINCLNDDVYYNVFEIGDNDMIITDSFSFDITWLVEKTPEVAKKVSDSSIYEDGYCKDTENIILDKSSNSFGIINVDSEGYVECNYDMLNTVKVQNINDVIVNFYNYEYGDEEEKNVAIDYLEPYFYNSLEAGSDLDDSIEIYISYAFIEESLLNYNDENYNSTGMLDTTQIILDYSEYETVYSETEDLIKNKEE